MALGPELLIGGDFEASTGTGAGSVLVGPQTDYIVCGPNLFNAPCGGQRLALFTGNAGTVTGNYATATTIRAIGSRSLAVNVSNNLTARIVYWTVPLVNGATYRASVTAAQMGGPFNLGLRIDGTLVLNMPGPLQNSIWTRQQSEFVWQGTTGNHVVAFTSNDPTLGGNDHAFDNFSLRMVTPSRDCGCLRPRSCAELGTPDWFKPFPPVDPDWQYSSDGGNTWSQAPTTVAHPAGTPFQQRRWRQLFTIPNGFRGQWRIGISGDKFDNSGQVGAGAFFMDGIEFDSNTGANATLHWSPWINVSPGLHTFEWREPQYNNPGNTVPVFSVDYGRASCLPGF